MHNKKNENNDEGFFKIPKKLVIFRSDIVYGILAIMIIIVPFLIVILLKSYSLIDETFYRIMMIIGALYATTVGSLVGVLYMFIPDYIHRLQNYPIKKWIIKNIRCPICGGNFNNSKPIRKKARFFYEFMFICESCCRKFVPRNLSRYEQKLEEYNKK